MTRLMIATALTTTIATSAFAMTDAQIEQIENFSADVNVEALSETQLETAYTIVTSGDDRSNKLARLRALEAGDNPEDMAMISAAEMDRLERYAPNADLSMISQAQAEAAIAVIYGGGTRSEKGERVEAILNDYMVVETMAADISEGRLNIIQEYAPNVDANDLSEQDVQLIMNFIHSGMSRGEKLNRIDAVVNG